jgi:hypothetical protein
MDNCSRLSFEEVLIGEVKVYAKETGAGGVCAVAITSMVGGSTRAVVEITSSAAISACESNGMTDSQRVILIVPPNTKRSFDEFPLINQNFEKWVNRNNPNIFISFILFFNLCDLIKCDYYYRT